MITLYANSLNSVAYSTYVSGVPVQAEFTPDVILTDHNGVQVTLSNSPVWSPSQSLYTLEIEDTEIPGSAIGHDWQFLWAWSYGGQIFSDTDYASVVSNEIGFLVNRLRRKIRDVGQVSSDYLLGDGVTTAFNLMSYPIEHGSEMVTVGTSSIPSSGYRLGLESGRITFVEAPTSGGAISVVYVHHNYSTPDIEEYVKEGIAYLNNSLSSNYSLSNPVLSDWEKQVTLLYSMRELYLDEMLSGASTSFLWKDGEKSVNKSSVAGAYKDAISLLEEKIKRLINEKLRQDTTGFALSGGAEAVKFVEIDWERVNARDTIAQRHY